jgi:hypothetical protein
MPMEEEEEEEEEEEDDDDDDDDDDEAVGVIYVTLTILPFCYLKQDEGKNIKYTHMGHLKGKVPDHLALENEGTKFLRNVGKH